jgi:UDP-glucose 4-epimerase
MSSGDRKIVITGIAGRLGRILARRLHRDGKSRVVWASIAAHSSARPKDIEHVKVDLRTKKARDVFRAGDVDALVPHGRHARPAEVRGGAPLVEHRRAP